MSGNKQIGIFLSIALLCAHLSLLAQCPVTDFNAPANACVSENISLENLSDPGLTYLWDFCSGDLENTFTSGITVNEPQMERPANFSLTEIDNEWFGFATSTSGNKIIRLDYGANLSNNPTVNIIDDLRDINDLPVTIVSPRAIHIIEENGRYYAGVIGFSNSDFWVLDFGTDIRNDPVAMNAGATGLSGPYDMALEQEDGEVIAIVSNFSSGNVVILNFGSSILNSPASTPVSISGGTQLTGIDLLKDCDQWYGLLVHNRTPNARAWKLSFNAGLDNPPTVSLVNLLGNDLRSLRAVKLIREQDRVWGFVHSGNGLLYRIRFDLGMNNTLSLENLGTLGLLSGPLGLDIGFQNSTWYAFSINNSNNQVIRTTFDDNCNVSTGSSTDPEPIGISYSAAGTYDISLQSFDSNGNTDITTRSIAVSSSIAPDISFTRTMNGCAGEDNTYSGVNNTPSQTITSWTWDFGDGSPVEMGQVVNHQYTAAGNYTIQLVAVSNDGCQQQSAETISVYEEPVPDFVTTGTLCSNATILFVNQSTTIESETTWFWDFGDGTSSTERDPIHTYALDGDYTVTLTATLPGCEAFTASVIMVQPGPLVDFDFSNECAGEIINFTDQTTGGGLVNWFWDFGDGTTSTLQNPDYFYGIPGSYEVQLTVTNDQGCVASLTQPITIHAIPQVNFSTGVACSEQSIQFFDLTTIESANPVSWDWDFGDGATSTIQNPFHVYSDPGSYDVKLIVASNFGCVDSLTQSVSVLQSPTAAYAYTPGCTGDTLFFTDQSMGNGPQIIDWLWQIDGQVFTEQNPYYVFNSPGDFLVELTVTSENFCTHTYGETITVFQQSTLDFTVFAGCTGVFSSFENESEPADGDAFISFFWDFDGLGTSNLESPDFVFEDEGIYQVTLQAETANGCTMAITQPVEIIVNPVSIFDASATIGAPPLTVDFTNISQNASAYIWNFGDGSPESVLVEPTHTFEEIGSYEVRLTSFNENCFDQQTMTIRVVEPELDVALNELVMTQAGNSIDIDLTISNNGSLVIDSMEILVKVDGAVTLKEEFEGTIRVGEEIQYPMSISLVNNGNLKWFCIELVPDQSNIVEENTRDNEQCAELNNLFVQLDPFPNPVTDVLNLVYVTPGTSNISVEIYNTVGTLVETIEMTSTQEGRNSIEIDMSYLANGLYIVRSSYEGQEKISKILKN